MVENQERAGPLSARALTLVGAALVSMWVPARPCSPAALSFHRGDGIFRASQLRRCSSVSRVVPRSRPTPRSMATSSMPASVARAVRARWGIPAASSRPSISRASTALVMWPRPPHPTRGRPTGSRGCGSSPAPPAAPCRRPPPRAAGWRWSTAPHLQS